MLRSACRNPERLGLHRSNMFDGAAIISVPIALWLSGRQEKAIQFFTYVEIAELWRVSAKFDTITADFGN